MPSLTRFLMILALIAAVAFGLVYLVATGIEPTPREMVTPVPLPRSP